MQVLVQNRLAVAMPRLPEEVQRQGVTAKKQSTNIVLAVSLYSDDNRYSDLYLANYATLRVKDQLSRVSGVGDVNVIGAGSYGMRIWIDPEQLKARNLTTQEVLLAIREQNTQVAAGQVGAFPAPESNAFQLNVTTRGRLADPEQFGDIIIKADDSGMEHEDGHGASMHRRGAARLTRPGTWRIELGSQVYDQWCEISGRPAATLAVFQLPGANALEVAAATRKAMDAIAPLFPAGMKHIIPFDTTVFVEESVHEVYKTLIEAGVLVLIVILVFLQDWRAVLIPATTVPVTIIGAFAAMAALGFSVNMLTLFGLVLAIGIVVDDAIVIVENAAHHIDHGKLPPKEATIKAMGEVLGPVIGITLVLSAVFLPTAFLGGITGQLYRQFALDDRRHGGHQRDQCRHAQARAVCRLSATDSDPQECLLSRVQQGLRHLRELVRRGYPAVGSEAGARHAGVRRSESHSPAGGSCAFQPDFCRPRIKALRSSHCNCPTLRRRRARELSLLRSTRFCAIRRACGWFLLGGQSVLDQAIASNAAAMYITFTPWDERVGSPALTQDAIIGSLMGQFQKVREAMIFAFPPPAIMGLGVAGGFEMQLQDRGGVGLSELEMAVRDVVAAGNSQSGLTSLRSTFRAGVPSLYVDIDREKAKSLGVSLDAIFSTLQTAGLGLRE